MRAVPAQKSHAFFFTEKQETTAKGKGQIGKGDISQKTKTKINGKKKLNQIKKTVKSDVAKFVFSFVLCPSPHLHKNLLFFHFPSIIFILEEN